MAGELLNTLPIWGPCYLHSMSALFQPFCGHATHTACPPLHPWLRSHYNTLMLGAHTTCTVCQPHPQPFLPINIDRKSTSELQSPDHLVSRLLLKKKKAPQRQTTATLPP